MTNKKGKFIVIEGIGASGKDSQIKLLAQYLKTKKINSLITREHTRDTPAGILIEKILKKQEDQIDPQALQLLFISDRRNHYIKVIKPAIDKGKLVVENRYYSSNVAYSDDKWRKKFLDINQTLVGRPDLVIIIDISAKEALRRLAKRGDQDIFDKLKTLDKCRRGYLWYAKNSGDKCVLVDGNGTKEEVFNRILMEINKLNIIKAGDKV